MDQAAYFAQMRERRKNDILDMARKMILDQGIASFQMQQLARNMDVSAVTLYKYFRNSEDVMMALRRRTMEYAGNADGAIDTTALQKEAGVAASERMFSLFRKGLTHMAEHREDLTVLVILEGYLRKLPETVRAEDYVLFLTGKTCEELVFLLEEGKQEGDFRKDLNNQEAMGAITYVCASLLRHMGMAPEEKFVSNPEGWKKLMQETLELLRRLVS